MLGACATRYDAVEYSAAYHLPAVQRTVWRISDRVGQPLGWLYGAIHVGTQAKPSLSVQALRAIDQAHAVYFDYTDDQGGDFTLRDASRLDILARVHDKKISATDAQLLEQVRNPPTVARLIEDPKLEQKVEQLWNRCGLYAEFGTEWLVTGYLVGKPMGYGALETSGTQRRDLALYRSGVGADLAEVKVDLPEGEAPEASILRACASYRHAVALIQDGEQPERDQDALMVLRNRTMADYIDLILRSNIHPFVAVGSAHLMGHDSVLTLLRDKGYRVEPVADAPPR